MSSPHATLSDLAGAGALVGRRVRFLDRNVPSVLPFGTIGEVVDVRSYEPRATVHYVREDLHERHPWRTVDLESPFRCLELVE